MLTVRCGENGAMNKNNTIDIDQLLIAAEKYWQVGHLQEAATLYTEVLSRNPSHPHGNYMMGQIALRTRNYAVAEKMIRTAILLNTENSYMYYKTLGDLFRDRGDLPDAIANYKNAIALKPDYVDALNNLGTASMISGKIEDAYNNYRKILEINPKHPMALYNLGFIHESQNKIDDAKNFYLKAIEADPFFSEAYNNAGTIFKNSGDLEEAKKYYIEATKLKPDFADAHFNLGVVLRQMKQTKEALKAFLTTISIRPSPESHLYAAQAYHILGQYDKSAEHSQSALALRPDYIDAMSNLASAYFYMKSYEKTQDVCEQILKLDPHHGYALNNMGNALKMAGQTDQAIGYYKEAIQAQPYNHKFYSNLFLTMLYSASVSPEALAEATRAFGDTMADPLWQDRDFTRDINPERVLRIGYVSPDFASHAVNFFFQPLLKNHDGSKFQTYAYSNVYTEDHITQQLKKQFDYWRDIRAIDGDKAADMIKADKIDILIDLTGHTANNRLLIFARKPAPIQVTWLGYPATTGMKAMDYRITDFYAEPEGMTEHLNVEELWRLPNIFCCYGAPERTYAVIDHPPFEDNGYITFGCFNNFTKVTDVVLDTWREILLQVPDSRLMLEISGADGPRFQATFDERLRKLQIPKERLIVVPRQPSNQFVLYNKIDMALDPFPCAGGTTSMDTMWMGVPLITLAGRHFVSRMGVTILTNVGLPELIAENIDEYIAKAVALANDRDRLRSIRHNLRDRVLASPLMDQKLFAKNMEDAYRAMWKKWCLTALE